MLEQEIDSLLEKCDTIANESFIRLKALCIPKNLASDFPTLCLTYQRIVYLDTRTGHFNKQELIKMSRTSVQVEYECLFVRRWENAHCEGS